MDRSLEKGPAGRPQVKAKYEVQVQHGLQWLQGEAKMSLQSTWKPSSDRPGIHLDDLVTLKSRFKTPRPVDDHLYHHRCFRDFITIIHGCGIYFRRHTARDQAFPYMTLDGSVHGAENVELICNRTVPDYGHPEPSSRALFQPILSIKSVTPKLLTTRAGKYKEWASYSSASWRIAEIWPLRRRYTCKRINERRSYRATYRPSLRGVGYIR
jgi:hypothetical protein